MPKPRIQLSGVQYSTGTSQKWTSTYTWQDYVALSKLMFSPMEYVPQKVVLWNTHAAQNISKFFEKHPELLLEAEPFKGLSLEEIKMKARYVNL